MSYSPQDFAELAGMLRGLAAKWPDDARGHDLEKVCQEAGLYVSEAWRKGFFHQAAWIKLRDRLYQPQRGTEFDFYCRSVEFLWWGWDGGRWTKDADWPDSPEDRPAKADMPRLANSRDSRLTLASSDGRVMMDSGPPAVKGPPASAPVLRHGCIVWARIFEYEAIAAGSPQQPQVNAKLAKPPLMVQRGKAIVELSDALAKVRHAGDVCGVLAILIRSIEGWAVALKQGLFEFFEDTDDGEYERRMNVAHSPMRPGFILMPFVGAAVAYDLVELSIGEEQARALGRRIKGLEDQRGKFGDAVVSLGTGWDDDEGKDYEAWNVVDRHRSDLKQAAFDVCHYIESLIHLIEAGKVGRLPQQASTNPLQAAPDTKPKAVVPDDDIEQAPALKNTERQVLHTLAMFDPSVLASAAEVAEAMAPKERLSDRTIRPAIARLVELDLAERPEGERQGVRLTIPGRRLASKIAD